MSTLVRIVGCVAVLAGLALSGPTPVRGHGNEHGKSDELAPAERPVGQADRSIYLLGSQWRDDQGALVPIDALRGQPVLLAMAYTTCENACPVIVEDMKRIEQALPPEERSRVIFALFSFDPARDTPAVLAAYRIQRGISAHRWRLFTGDPDDVLELAVVLGVKYKPDGFGGFAHSNLITVLDAQGVVRHQQVGLRADPAASLAALHSLLGR